MPRDSAAMDGGILDPREHVAFLAETGLGRVWQRYQHTHDWPPAIALAPAPGEGYRLVLEIACPVCEGWLERMRQRIADRFAPRPLDDTGIALIVYGVLSTLQDPDLVEEIEAPLR